MDQTLLSCVLQAEVQFRSGHGLAKGHSKALSVGAALKSPSSSTLHVLSIPFPVANLLTVSLLPPSKALLDQKQGSALVSKSALRAHDITDLFDTSLELG